MSIRYRLTNVLDRRNWIYVLSLLVPLFAYCLTLKVVGLVSEYPASGVWDTLRLLRSELLFDTGYALLWIGLFAVVRRGVWRGAVLMLFHVTAILVVVISTVAYQYFMSTGTVLDYGMVAYYLIKPGEAGGAVSSNAPTAAWLILSGALLYLLPGPWLITRALGFSRTSEDTPEHASGAGSDEARTETPTPGRGMSRREFLAAGVGSAAGVLEWHVRAGALYNRTDRS